MKITKRLIGRWVLGAVGIAVFLYGLWTLALAAHEEIVPTYNLTVFCVCGGIGISLLIIALLVMEDRV